MKASTDQHREEIAPLILLLLAFGSVLVFPCVCAAVIARWLPQSLARQQRFWLCLAALGVMSAGGFLLLAHPWTGSIQGLLITLEREIVREAKTTTWNPPALWNDVLPFWLESLPFVPLATCLSHVLKRQNARERLLADESQRAQALAVASKRAQRQAKKGNVPDQIDQQIVLGLAIGRGLPTWVKKQCVILPTDELGKHGVVIGTSGSGKSNTLLRLAILIAQVLGWQIIMIDGKGDEQAGAQFVTAMKSIGIHRVKLFPAEPYNGWVGTPKAILSRLLAVEEFSDMHYRAIAENVLRLALMAPGKPVTTSRELLMRLNLTNEYLVGLYFGHAEEETYLEYMAKRDPLGVYNRYAALLSILDGQLDGAWSYDDVDAAYISLDGLALPGIVSGLARYFVEDFAQYAGQRKPRERRAIFIFDDLGSVDANLTNMFERVRACGVSVFVSGQSDQSIAFRGLLQNAERILASATTIILHACSHPQEILARAGTKIIVEESSQTTGGSETDRRSLRLKEVLNVHPNEVMQLPTGEAYVIAHGKAQRVRVLPVALQDTNNDAAPQNLSDTLPASTQTTNYDLTTGLTDDNISLIDNKNSVPGTVDEKDDDDLLS